jgi:hypothetical protein
MKTLHVKTNDNLFSKNYDERLTNYSKTDVERVTNLEILVEKYMPQNSRAHKNVDKDWIEQQKPQSAYYGVCVL